MQNLEHRTVESMVAERWPHWFNGRRRALTKPLLHTLGRWSKIDDAYEFLQSNLHRRGFDFVSATIPFLDLRYNVEEIETERKHIPATGRLLIVANHPSGALDALALLDFVGSVRRDVKIVANDFLMAIEPLQELFLPIRVLGGKPSADSVVAIEQALREEQCVIVFPAGEVSRLSARGVTDTRWRRGFLRFARATHAPVLPIRIDARNSALFYGASALFKPVGTALLVREMFKRGGRTIRLRVGEVMDIEPGVPAIEALRKVRAALYAIGKRKDAVPQARLASPAPQEIVAPVEREVLTAAVGRLEVLGETADGKKIAVGTVTADSPLLREIGRLREITFRAVGEGTGRSLDVDNWDLSYEHIVVWDAPAQQIAGAYRVKRGAQALAETGLKGLYTSTLVDYADDALPRIAEGMELGRSFVAPDYWGSRSIDYLWQGIGAYLCKYRQVRYLFGLVSMSAALPLPAREQIVAYYQQFYGAEGGAASKRPFQYMHASPSFGDMDADAAFKLLKGNLDAVGATLPMLYKQYTELCEPGGVRFLAFGIDPDFGDSVDGLIEVDMHRLLPKKRQRYLERISSRKSVEA